MTKIGKRRSCLDAAGIGCSMCCFTHGVNDNHRRITNAFDWCEHCEVGGGCRVHETTQPGVCGEWKCAWLEGLGTDDERPDKTGIVLEWRYTRLGKTLVMMAGNPEAFQSEYAQRVMRSYTKKRIPLFCAHADGRKELVFEKGILIDTDISRGAIKEGVEITFIDTD